MLVQYSLKRGASVLIVVPILMPGGQYVILVFFQHFGSTYVCTTLLSWPDEPKSQHRMMQKTSYLGNSKYEWIYTSDLALHCFNYTASIYCAAAGDNTTLPNSPHPTRETYSWWAKTLFIQIVWSIVSKITVNNKKFLFALAWKFSRLIAVNNKKFL